jgi:hypothetical protein
MTLDVKINARTPVAKQYHEEKYAIPISYDKPDAGNNSSDTCS